MMGSKRKFSDFDADAPQHSNKKKSQSHDYNLGHHPTNRKSRNSNSKAKVGSINWLKKRARAIERRFKAGQNLPANIQNDMERELAHHKQKIAELSEEKHRKMMITKYHMVRFFERKKADRLAKQIRKQLDSATDEAEIEKLKADLHTAEIDSIYCRNFPYREPYISLYPVSSAHGKDKPEDASSAAKALRSERPPMWRTIEEAASKGEKALIEIRERKPAGNAGNRKNNEAQEPLSRDLFAPKPNRSKKNSISTSDPAVSRSSKGKRTTQTFQDSLHTSGSRSDDGSDGGFFEED